LSINIYREDQKLGIKIYGSKFDELKDCLKDNDFSFHKSWKGYDNIWVGEKVQAYRALLQIQKIEKIPLDKETLLSLIPKPETKFYRLPFKEDLLKSNPMGKYQEDGIKRGLHQNRLMLAWEMGLGKSFTVISILNHLWYHNLIDSFLVVAPSESIYNFRREIIQFSMNEFTEEDIYIANVNNRDPFNSEKPIIIMTYRTFLMLSDDAYKKKTGKSSKKYTSITLPIENWGSSRAIIADESHMIKNPQARQTKALHIHKEFFEYRYLLTGTPDPNGVSGWFSQINFMDDSIIGESYNSWIKTVANIGNRFSAQAINYYYPDQVKKFMKKVEPLVSREFAKDNLDLPEQLIKDTYVSLSKKQREIYQDLITYTLSILKEEEGEIIPRSVENKFPFIIQALENPSLLKGKIDKELSPSLHKKVETWKFKDHSKLEAQDSLLFKYLEEGRKVIIWSGHPLTMNEMAEHYKSKNPIVIHGQNEIPKGMTKDEFKNERLELFKKSKDHNLLIASYYVLSSAVNIVQATRTIYFDRSQNPTAWMQSLKRIHRIGQNERTIVHPLITEHSLEERLNRALKRKDKLNNNLTKYDSLSQSEWKSLFFGEEIFE